MPRHNRVQRSLNHVVNALDDNLFLIRRQLEGRRDDPAYFKILVSALRTLVCMSSRTEGLVWRLADELKVSDSMRIHCVRRVNKDSPQARGLWLDVMTVARLGEGPKGMPVADVNLKEFIKTCDAVFFAGNGYSWEEMIKMWSQQLGLSHESEGVDRPLAVLHQFPLFVGILQQALIRLTELVIEVEERLLACAETDHRYVRTERSGHGDLTVLSVLDILQQPIGKFPVFTMSCPLAGATISCTVLPSCVSYAVQRSGRTIGEVQVPFPSSGCAAIYALRYSSNRKQISMCMTDLIADESETESSQCDIGWIEGIEIRPPYMCEFPMDIVYCHRIRIHKSWLRPSDFREMFQFTGVLLE